MRPVPLPRVQRFVISRTAPMRGGDLAGFGEEYTDEMYMTPGADDAGFQVEAASASTPSEPDKPFDWGALSKGISVLPGLVNAAGSIYSTSQQGKLAQSAADLANAQARLAAARMQPVSSGMPSWVLPVAIGGGVLLLLGGFFLTRRPSATNPRRR